MRLKGMFLKPFLVAFLILPSFTQAATSARQLAADYHTWFQNFVAEEGIPGAAFAVVTREQILEIGTSGHTRSGGERPIDQNTTFRVASVSKTFAAGLAGVLISEGRFGWDDPVTEHVPEFRFRGDYHQVRVRHVLGQSTGLVPHAYDNLIEDGVPLPKIYEQIGRLSPICSPGRCYSYQNSVYSLIQPIVENTTRSSYERLLEQRIFEPLDMKTASTGYESFVGDPNHAEPHVRGKSGWRRVKVKPNYYSVAPAAGVNASVLDMAKWVRAQLGSHPDVIAPETVDALTRPRVRTSRELYRREWREMLTDAHYGLGWRVYQLGPRKIAYHSGWVSGFRADIAWSEEYDIGITVLLNAEARSINRITTNFWEMAFEGLEQKENPLEGAALPVAAVGGK
jgi:beta-lactamase class C